jgi:hypothetical protein
MIMIAGRDTGLTRDCTSMAGHPPSNRLKRMSAALGSDEEILTSARGARATLRERD